MDKVRIAALKILYEIDKNKAYMNILLSQKCSEEGFCGRDSAFLSELVKGTVRNRYYIDYVIGLYSKVKIKKISPWIMNVLRLGVYQLKFADKVPESAAVNESVALAKKFGHSSSAGFVNAVLRKISAEKEIPMPQERVKYLSVKYSYPEWIVEKFTEDFKENAEKILKAGNKKADTVIRANTLKISAEKLCLKLQDTALFRNGNMIHIKSNIPVDSILGFQEGLFTVQAEPFNKAAELLEPKEGMTVIDACAAPGGKTTYIAELMKNKGVIYAFDIYEQRLKMINDTSNRLGINIIRTRIHDATEPALELKDSCDRLLLDVPCSGLGIIRRRPDIKWNREPEDFSVIQKKILENMSKTLKSGGILVYSTCSIDKRENELVVLDFLENHSEFFPIPFEGAKNGYKTWYPGEDGCDGAFICKMGRK